jgi:transcriptional regulator with XRE-family HTH domain
MNRIREFRMNMGISMTEAAARLGMPYTTYVNYEKGVREPKQEVLLALAAFYSTTVDALLGREESASGHAVTDEDIKFALFGGDGEITDAMYEEVRSFAAFVKRREAQKRKE